MLDLAWSEIALIAVVALVVIGPKDLPEAVRGVARGIQKLRRMASEFQGHVDEVVREAKLEEVRDQIRDIRNFDVKGEIERAVDKDGEIRRTFQDDPLRNPTYDVTRPGPAGPGADSNIMGPPAPEAEPAPTPAEPGPAEASSPAEPPAFIPPGAAPPAPPGPSSSSTASADSLTKPTPPATSV
jgi:sec-independent protein translocase protein TatB